MVNVTNIYKYILLYPDIFYVSTHEVLLMLMLIFKLTY